MQESKSFRWLHGSYSSRVPVICNRKESKTQNHRFPSPPHQAGIPKTGGKRKLGPPLHYEKATWILFSCVCKKTQHLLSLNIHLVFASQIQTAASVLALKPGSKNPTERLPCYPPAVPRTLGRAASALLPRTARAGV